MIRLMCEPYLDSGPFGKALWPVYDPYRGNMDHAVVIVVIEMPATQKRTYSRYALEGLGLLGKMIRLGRMERRLTDQELAERIGRSRRPLPPHETGAPPS